MERNPSPPPVQESGGCSDKIGSTAFSKRFVLNVLLDVLKEAKESENEPEEIAELGKDLEDSLSQLWDMSVDPEVGCFLLESDVFSIFSEAVTCTNKPRLVEILVGILGNIACDGKNIEVLLSHEDVPNFCFAVLRYRDTPTLVEITRLILCVLEAEKWGKTWNEKMEEWDAWSSLSFIISSTTNESLLWNAAQIVDILLDAEEVNVLERLSSHPPESWKCLLDGLEEAVKLEHIPASASLCHSLYSMTIHKTGREALVTDEQKVSCMLCKCLLMIRKTQDVCRNVLTAAECALLTMKNILAAGDMTLFQSDLEQVRTFLEDVLNQPDGISHELKPDVEKCLKHIADMSEK